jgi:hypothetical protein
MIAMLISFLPRIEIGDIKRAETTEQPVFQLSKPIELKQVHMVPFLKEMPLHYSFKQVKLDQSSIFIDLQIIQSELTNNKELVYQDALTVLSKLLIQTTNIDQIYVRFILVGDERSQLVLSVTAERDNRLVQKLLYSQELIDVAVFLKENTRLFYGTGWSTE